MTKKQIILFVIVILVAIFFRTYLLSEMPGGLFPDEAANGLDINSMEQGDLEPFYPRGNGREALFFYMIWGAVKTFGRSPFAHHLVSAIVGILSTVLTMVFTKKLFSLKLGGLEQDKNSSSNKIAWAIAICAGLIMATSSWHIVLSRTAFRANLIPLFSTLTLTCILYLASAKTTIKSYLWAVFTGASFALGFYTYIAYRIMVPIVAMVVIWPFLFSLIKNYRNFPYKRYLSILIISLFSFTVFVYPLAHYFYTHPGSFIGRSGQVSVFNPELNHGNLIATVIEVAKQSILGYFTQGDLNWRHNISGFPFLSPIISPFFGLGLVLVTLLALRYFFRPIKRAQDYPYFILSVWFFGMLLPVITTAEGIPHGLRSIGTIPVVFIISAWTITVIGLRISDMLKKCRKLVSEFKFKIMKRAAWSVAVAMGLALIIQSYSLYFIYAYNSPENFYSFRSDLTYVSNYLKTEGNRSNTYLIVDKFSVQTVDYLTTVEGKTSCDRDLAYRVSSCTDNPKNKPYIQIDPESSWCPTGPLGSGLTLERYNAKCLSGDKSVWTNGLFPGDKVVFTQSSIFDIKQFKEFHPNSTLTTELRNKFGQAVVAVYTIQ